MNPTDPLAERDEPRSSTDADRCTDQDAFIVRGMRSYEEAFRIGEFVEAGTVLAKLEAMSNVARARFAEKKK